VLEQLRKTELREKLSKSEFKREEIEILGYIINKYRVRPNPEHLAALKEWKESTSKKEV
jgi:hypothetical protein